MISIFSLVATKPSMWREAGIQPYIKNQVQQVEGIKTLIFYLLRNLPTEVCSTFYIILWNIWRQCNDKVWNNLETPPNIIVSLAKQFHSDWLHARNYAHDTTTNRDTHQLQTWDKPPQGQVKSNVDAALFKQQQSFGVGFCIRNLLV